MPRVTYRPSLDERIFPLVAHVHYQRFANDVEVEIMEIMDGSG